MLALISLESVHTDVRPIMGSTKGQDDVPGLGQLDIGRVDLEG